MLFRNSIYLSFLTVIWLCSISSLTQAQGRIIIPEKQILNQADAPRTTEKPDQIFAVDKAGHFMGSLISTVFFYKFFQEPMQVNENSAKIYAAGITITLGISKELYDRSRPGKRFSWWDLMADMAGIAGGLIIANQP